MQNKEPIDLHFETVALANYAITKRLLTFLVAEKLLDDSELQAILDASALDILRTTLPISREQAQQALAFFWSDFTMRDPDTGIQ
ncbi:hypothetical protein [Caballeronia sp. LZ001]|uniref:hypothetical protein n=1 Tax=Caballeronia sp. LZ001 TaxID=3038553 RepID=UPI0028664994|nr:hypothetical protein [Caballeronia sp. LZ001]MDR5803415.1 hypothetical protein [Caballeronia sp. LZ001]